MGAVRRWLARRRINRILAACGWRISTSVFTGNVVLSETVYAPGTYLLASAEKCEEFAAFYITHCGKPKEAT